MTLIGNVLNSWESWGVFSLILPFLLVFAIFYGILSNIKLFEDNKGINVMLSFVMALTATAVGYYGNCLRAVMFAFAITLIVILIYFLFVSFLTKNKKIINYSAAVIAIAIFITTFIRSKECDVAFLNNLGSYIYLIPIAIIMGLIIWIILGKSSKPDKPGKFGSGKSESGPELEGPGSFGGGPGGRGGGKPSKKAKKPKSKTKKPEKEKKPDDRDEDKDKPDPYSPSSDQPDRDGPDPYSPDGDQPDPYQPDPYQPDPYDPYNP